MTKKEKAFVVSLITIIILPICLWPFVEGLIGNFLDNTPPALEAVLAILPTLIIIAGLFFMEISKTKGGGIIVLIVGITIGMLGFLAIETEEVVMGVFLSIPAVMAITGGYLGVQGARENEIKKTQYSKTFMFKISLMGFISALLSVFIFFFPLMMEMKGVLIDQWIFLAVIFPIFWVISIILNTISTVIISRGEGKVTLEKRTKVFIIVLIIVTWCIIAPLLAFLSSVLFINPLINN